MIHHLKIEERWLKALLDGNKTFEVRKNDRAYKTGDFLEFFSNGSLYLFEVLSVFDDPEYVKDGYVILSINYDGVSRVKEQQK